MNKRHNVEKDCGVYSGTAFNDIFACPRGVYLRAAFIRGRRLMIFLAVPAAFIRGQRLFEGGVYSNSYGKGVILFLL